MTTIKNTVTRSHVFRMFFDCSVYRVAIPVVENDIALSSKKHFIGFISDKYGYDFYTIFSLLLIPFSLQDKWGLLAVRF